MKVNVRGKVGQQEVLEILSKVMNTLEAAGVEEYGGVNLYFNCYQGQEKVIPCVGASEITVSEKAKGYHREKIEDGEKCLYSVRKGADAGQINLHQKLENEDALEVLTEDEHFQREAEIAALKAEAVARQREAERLEMEEYYRRREERRRLDEARREFENKCRDHVVREYYDAAGRAAEIISSRGWLKSRAGIAKYTDRDVGEKVYRITARPKSGEPQGDVFLFDPSGELVYSSNPEFSALNSMEFGI